MYYHLYNQFPSPGNCRSFPMVHLADIIIAIPVLHAYFLLEQDLIKNMSNTGLRFYIKSDCPS